MDTPRPKGGEINSKAELCRRIEKLRTRDNEGKRELLHDLSLCDARFWPDGDGIDPTMADVDPQFRHLRNERDRQREEILSHA